MPDWHRLVFQLVPVLAVLVGFFLNLRSRIDRIEVRMGSVEQTMTTVVDDLEDKQSSAGCDNLHKTLGQRIHDLQLDVRELNHQIIELAKLIRRNGNGNH